MAKSYADAGALQQEIMFDDRLKAKVAIHQDKASFARYKLQKKWFTVPKNLAIIIYFVIVPFVQTPDWCINYFRERQDTRLVRPIFECT